MSGSRRCSSLGACRSAVVNVVVVVAAAVAVPENGRGGFRIIWHST